MNIKMNTPRKTQDILCVGSTKLTLVGIRSIEYDPKNIRKGPIDFSNLAKITIEGLFEDARETYKLKITKEMHNSTDLLAATQVLRDLLQLEKQGMPKEASIDIDVIEDVKIGLYQGADPEPLWTVTLTEKNRTLRAILSGSDAYTFPRAINEALGD